MSKILVMATAVWLAIEATRSRSSAAKTRSAPLRAARNPSSSPAETSGASSVDALAPSAPKSAASSAAAGSSSPPRRPGSRRLTSAGAGADGGAEARRRRRFSGISTR